MYGINVVESTTLRSTARKGKGKERQANDIRDLYVYYTGDHPVSLLQPAPYIPARMVPNGYNRASPPPVLNGRDTPGRSRGGGLQKSKTGTGIFSCTLARRPETDIWCESSSERSIGAATIPSLTRTDYLLSRSFGLTRASKRGAHRETPDYMGSVLRQT